MDSGQLILTIVVIVAVLLILGLALFFGRRWKQTKDRERAEGLRQSAAADELNAREREAKAARSTAEAQQAEVDAERLREEARNQAEEAQAARSRAQEQATKAESLDPEAQISERHPAEASDALQHHAIDPDASEPSRKIQDERDPRDGGTAQY